MFLKIENIIFKTRRSKVTDYAALNSIYANYSNIFLKKMLLSWNGSYLTYATNNLIDVEKRKDQGLIESQR